MSPKLFKWFFKFTQMLPSVKDVVKNPWLSYPLSMSSSHLKIMELALQIRCPLYIFTTIWTIFDRLHSTVPLSETVRRFHGSATLNEGQGYTSFDVMGFYSGGFSYPLNCCLVQIMFLVWKVALSQWITCFTYAYRGKSKHLKSQGIVSGYLIRIII